MTATAVSVTDNGGVYDFAQYPVTAATVTGVGGEGTIASFGSSLLSYTYYAGSTSLGSTAPFAPGSYTVVAHYAGSSNYMAVDSSAAPFNILKANTPSPTIGGLPTNNTIGEENAISLSAQPNDSGAGAVFGYSWSVSDSSGQTIPAGSASTYGFTPTAPGTYTVTLTVTDSYYTNPGTISETITVTPTPFQVTNFVSNASGFDVTFNRPADMPLIHLYSSSLGHAEYPSDVVVTGTSGAIAGKTFDGSLVWNAATNTASWVYTGGLLPQGSYTVTLLGNGSEVLPHGVNVDGYVWQDVAKRQHVSTQRQHAGRYGR